MSVIRLGATRCSSQNWKTYNEQYRLRKARSPTGSWSNVDAELWLIYMSGNDTKPFGNSTGYQLQPSNSSQRFRCYLYNYEGNCFNSPCQYSHSCMHCNGGHPVKRCHMKRGYVGTPQSRWPPEPPISYTYDK